MYRLTLEPELTIYQASQLKRVLMDCLHDHASLRLDFSAVQEIDCSALQALVWLRQEAARQGKQVVMGDFSPVVVDTLSLTGFTTLFATVSGESA